MVELLVVIALLSIVAGLSLPRFSRSWQGFVVDQDARVMAADFRRARYASIAAGTRYEVRFSDALPGRYEVRRRFTSIADPWDFAANRSGTQESESMETVWARRLQGSESLKTSAQTVIFDPDGHCNSTVVELRSRDQSLAVQVELDGPTGRVTVKPGIRNG